MDIQPCRLGNAIAALTFRPNGRHLVSLIALVYSAIVSF